MTNHAKAVFDDRYAMKDAEGEQLETAPEQMWERVAWAIAEVESESVREHWAREFYDALYDFKFVPGGRILAGMGTGADVTAYNCYVIESPHDSYDGIFENIHTMGQVMRRGGGVGVDLSTLRPKGEYVAGTNGYSSGPVAFAELYSQTTNITSQGGSRRGALMLMLRDDHPDIFEFINVKADLARITGANLSVKVSDELMGAVKSDYSWELTWNGEIYKTVKARDLWDAITTAAHRSAEPGLWFSERSNKEANSWYFEELIATNPCGEQPLGEWGVCNLGAINLAKFIDKETKEVRWRELTETVETAVCFLDNVIDVTNYHFAENERKQKEIRRVGLGTMGLADALIYLGVPYGSPEAVKLTDQLYWVISNVAYQASAQLAAEKGAFPAFDHDKYLQGEFIKRLEPDTRDLIGEHGIRNCYVLTQAPTGSTGSLAQVAGTGIEPVFDFEFRRSDRLGEHTIRLPIVDELIERGEIPADRADWPDYMTTARDLTPRQHVDMQAAIQRWNDSAVSKTVNAPKTYTPKDVAELYEYAYDSGLKGITVYVDGSREGVLNYLDEDVEEPAEKPAFTKRPEILAGKTVKTQTPFGKAYVTINENDDGDIEELFLKLGKTGADISAIADGLAIALTGALSPRLNGLTPDEKVRWLMKKFRGMSGETVQGFGEKRVSSLPDAVAKALQKYVNQDEVDVKPTTTIDADLCPSCGAAALVKEEGCANCKACGFSKC